MPSLDFINFPVAGGATRHYYIPLEKRVSVMRTFGPISVIIIFVSVVLAEVLYRRHVGVLEGVTGYCAKGKGIEGWPCLDPIAILYMGFGLEVILLIVFALIFIRIIRILRIKGPHLRIDREGFWTVDLASPIEFINVKSIRKGMFKSKIVSIIFVLENPPIFNNPKKSIGQTAHFSYEWHCIGYDDIEGIFGALEYLLNDKRLKT